MIKPLRQIIKGYAVKPSTDLINCTKSKYNSKKNVSEICYILHPEQRPGRLQIPAAIQKQEHIADIP